MIYFSIKFTVNLWHINFADASLFLPLKGGQRTPLIQSKETAASTLPQIF